MAAKTKYAGALAAVVGLLAAVGLLVLMLVVEAQPAEANYSGEPGKIAYSVWGGNDTQIYTIWPGGGGNRQLTYNNSSTVNILPAYSPNGKRIAYAGKVRNDSEIYTTKVGGGGKFNVTDNTSNDGEPTYSPSGKRIAYISGTGYKYELYTIKTDGSGKHRVTDNVEYVFAPYWGSR